MKYARLKIHENNHYYVIDYNDGGLCELAGFLSTEVTSPLSYDYFTDWLKDKYNQNWAHGDAYALTDYRGKVLVSLQPGISDFEPEDEACVKFISTKEQILEVIDNWLKTIFDYKDKHHKLPEEMLIEQNDIGKVVIKARE